MHSHQSRVAILYGLPRPPDGAAAASRRESEAGVIAEVSRVADALHLLGVAYRVAPISRMSDLYRVLGGTEETVVFNLVEEPYGRYQAVHRVPTIVRSLGKSCTGNTAACLALCLDKGRTKKLLAASGVPTPVAVCVPVGRDELPEGVPSCRLIVKPLRADGSEGIDASSVVEGPGQDLLRAIQRVHREFAQPALVEQFIEGREVSVSLLQRGHDPSILPLAEIDFSSFPEDKPRIVDYAAKWLPGTFQFENTHRKIPADLQPETAAEIRRLASVTWKATGCHAYARVDLRLDNEGRPFVLEVNPNPDIGPDSGFVAALEAAEISYAQFISFLLMAAH